jgi:DNA-binding response OmpR family regulator
MKKVLFIEDEFTLQKAMAETLTKAGYKMVQALDGEAGLRLAFSEKPDLILLDIILPKMDGFQVLEKLKKEEETKNIPVIVLTNLGSAEDIERSLSLGATTYLVKSDHAIEDVLTKVKQAIG